MTDQSSQPAEQPAPDSAEQPVESGQARTANPTEVLAAMADLRDQLAAQNAAKVQEMAARGIKVWDPFFVKPQLELLLEWTLGGADSPRRLSFDVEYQEKVAAGLAETERMAAELIEQAQAEARKQALVQGVPLSAEAQRAMQNTIGGGNGPAPIHP